MGIEALLLNTSFRSWVLSRDPEAAAYWTSWMAEDPERVEMVNYARSILLSMHVDEEQFSEEEIEQEIKTFLLRVENHAEAGDRIEAATFDQALDESLDESVIPDEPVSRGRILSLDRGRWWKAACVFILVVSSVWIWQRNTRGKTDPTYSYETFVQESGPSSVEYVNTADSLKKIVLPDGSIVLLAAQSKLSFAGSFGNRREVFLVGEAFFDISRDPGKPFFVFTKDITTKVLGTSFRVRAYATDQKTLVTVKTGKVSVYKREVFPNPDSKPNMAEGTVVVPNQEVIYHKQIDALNKTLIDAPEEITPTPKSVFDFDDTPLSKVFDVLQRTYGIVIVFDEQTVSSCTLSVSMGEESFYDKLKLICKTTNASYEIIDGNIVINSNGCK